MTDSAVLPTVIRRQLLSCWRILWKTVMKTASRLALAGLTSTWAWVSLCFLSSSLRFVCASVPWSPCLESSLPAACPASAVLTSALGLLSLSTDSDPKARSAPSAWLGQTTPPLILPSCPTTTGPWRRTEPWSSPSGFCSSSAAAAAASRASTCPGPLAWTGIQSRKCEHLIVET